MIMKVYEFNAQEGIYYIAPDRIVKRIGENLYETYRITVLDYLKTLTINRIDFNEIDAAYIDQKLSECGLIYHRDQGKIVQKHDEAKVVESDREKIPYVLSDRLSYSGYVHESATTYQFNHARELNEILLEHDIPIKYTNSMLEDL